jgi:hypothetical protein
MEVGSSSSITLGAFLPLSPASQAETGEVPKLPGQQTTQDDSGPYRLDSNTVEQQLPLLASSLLSSAAATSPQKQPASRVAAAQQVAAPHLAGAPSDPTPVPAAPAAPAGASTGEVSGEGAGGASAATETDETGDSATEELTEEEQQQVQELTSRDREVRQHEQAHMAAAGGHARGGPSYEYTTGPDNRRYATGGEVSIDTSKANDPAATISKAQAIYRAALAPAEPSSQDRSVASAAKQMEAEARREMAESRRSEASEGE